MCVYSQCPLLCDVCYEQVYKQSCNQGITLLIKPSFTPGYVTHCCMNSALLEIK